MNNEEHIQEASQELAYLSIIPNVERSSYTALMEALTSSVNDLINDDFAALVQLLYRLDIPEHKLKSLLKENPSNSAAVIAELIIERQVEKIKTRRSFKQEDDIPEDEKW